MDSKKNHWIISLGHTSGLDVHVVGGKAASLGKLISAGVRVPYGFCLTVFAYQHFLDNSDLPGVIQMELGRKPLDKMRWEEIWDAALRIRSAFLRAPLPPELVQAVSEALRQLNSQHPLAIRSSALGEDSAQRSFAGLHESIVNIQGTTPVLRAVRTVWASLWSDAALLYRKELSLDPLQSRMAVIIQEMVPAENSGVAFGRDPRDQTVDREIIEAVPGPCSNLVDGLLDPDRWILRQSTGDVVEWHVGEREGVRSNVPLLKDDDLRVLHTRLRQVEELFGWPPDMEWAEQGGTLSVLQARPITSGLSAPESDERRWYLTLRPKLPQLRRLAEKVSHTLIPELERLGEKLAGEGIEKLNDRDLADCIKERLATLISWRGIYKEEFIPLAHGVRFLGAYYNEALQPQDPYEFMALLRGQDFLASYRNVALSNLGRCVQKNEALYRKLTECAMDLSLTSSNPWAHFKEQIPDIQGGADFLEDFERFLTTFMDTTYNGERLVDRPDSLFNLICQLGNVANVASVQGEQNEKDKAMVFQERLIEAVGESQAHEAREVIAIGQLSWRLRDDDNILLGRIESQFLRALHLGAKRLQASGRLTGKLPGEKFAPLVAQALRDGTHDPIHLDEDEPKATQSNADINEKPRQLIGQPASHGLAEGQARLVNSLEDFRNFQRGDILVCESIQPTMTHLVPLASAIVERRGGMLIHGAIIARELGIPCVNGISNATNVICEGDQLTVDGYLGIVTIGAPDFALESQAFSEKR
ncbi:MAG: PEP-utilizing enzyme [Nitrospirota bacterium]|nr:PEP-utilizing enzyme [Nitrospirota bacterium]